VLEDLDTESPATVAVAAFNETLPEAVRFKLIWEVAEPLPAEFYLGPEGHEE
jgi:hypothetical protein